MTARRGPTLPPGPAPVVPALPSARATAAFERRIAAALASHVSSDAPLVVACSGGPDSLATLVAVARTRLPGLVTAAHFDHRLRPAAEVAAERAIVETTCVAVGAAFAAGRASRPPTDRGEAAARESRYRWLAAACGRAGAPACVTGHTLDDQAETVLLRLTRGTGLGGAAGMAPSGSWPVTPARGVRAPHLLRPLLAITRAEVEAYLAALGLTPARDPSNATPDYARNRVRLEVVPALRSVNPRAAHQIAAFADRARGDDDALSAWAARAFAKIAECTPDSVCLDRRALLELPDAVASRVVRIAAGTLGATVDRATAHAALHAARAGGRRAALGQGLEALREGNALVLRPEPEREAKVSEKLPAEG